MRVGGHVQRTTTRSFPPSNPLKLVRPNRLEAMVENVSKPGPETSGRWLILSVVGLMMLASHSRVRVRMRQVRPQPRQGGKTLGFKRQEAATRRLAPVPVLQGGRVAPTGLPPASLGSSVPSLSPLGITTTSVGDDQRWPALTRGVGLQTVDPACRSLRDMLVAGERSGRAAVQGRALGHPKKPGIVRCFCPPKLC